MASRLFEPEDTSPSIDELMRRAAAPRALPLSNGASSAELVKARAPFSLRDVADREGRVVLLLMDNLLEERQRYPELVDDDDWPVIATFRQRLRAAMSSSSRTLPS